MCACSANINVDGILKFNILPISHCSNGKLDPWSRGGFLESISKSIVAIVIDEGAHHLDLRSSNPADPPSVIRAREQEKNIIRGWIKEYKNKISEHNTYHLMFENHSGNVLTGVIFMSINEYISLTDIQLNLRGKGVVILSDISILNVILTFS